MPKASAVCATAAVRAAYSHAICLLQTCVRLLLLRLLLLLLLRLSPLLLL